MKSKKFKGSFLLDALSSFALLLTLILLFLPFTINQHQLFKNEIENAEMKRILLTALHRFKYTELKQGVEIEHFQINENFNEVCINNLKSTKKLCVKK